MDGDNQKPASQPESAVAENHLNHDEIVSLRSTTPEKQPVSPASGTTGDSTAESVSNDQQPEAPASEADKNGEDAHFFSKEDGAGMPADRPPTDTAVAGNRTTPYALPEADVVNDREGFTASGQPEISWTASEFVAHPKEPVWYLALAGIGIVATLLAYLVSHDIFTVVVVILCFILFGVAAARPPRQLQYAIYPGALQIGSKQYPFTNFRSFAVVDEGAFSSIDFMPLKRFSPILSIYYDPRQESRLLDMLSAHLPMAPHKRTIIDNLLHQIHF